MENAQAERAPDQSREETLRAAMDALADDTHAIAPVAGGVRKEQLAPLRTALAAIAAASADAADAGGNIASLYARCAAIAIAAGDEATAHRWLLDAARLAPEEAHAELAAAREQPEQFRALAHGRMRFRTGDERGARKIWKKLAAGSGALAAAAAVELAAPRPLRGGAPTLANISGFGLGFAGARDEWPDGSYTTTHCLTALFVPVFPLGAYRVVRHEGGWIVLAREQLSALARGLRYAAIAAVVLLVAGLGAYGYFTDPDRRARQRYDDALASVATLAPEAAIAQLEPLLAGGDADRSGPVRLQRVAAEIIRKTAALAAPQQSADGLPAGYATRLVQRYRSLPEAAREGLARDAVVDALEGWRAQLGTSADSAEERLALLRLAVGVAAGPRAAELARQMTALRLAVADAKAADWPLDALAILVDPLTAESMQRATVIVARIVEAPSLLTDAGAALDAWLAAAAPSDALRQAVISQRELAASSKRAAEAEGAAAAELAAMEKARPWDQFVQLRLAAADVDAGKLDAAAARLEKLGPPGMIVRDGQLMLAQIASARGKLEQADALLARLLANRLPGFLAAASQLELLVVSTHERLWSELRAGPVPDALHQQLEAAETDAAKARVATEWVQARVEQDPAIQQARERFAAASDAVEIALAAGSVKLRRAQSATGAARSALLVAAERAFLAIRTAAEGQPQYQLGLGEIYARLGKTKESEAAFAAVLERKDPELSLGVAQIHRNLGNVERATQIATEVYDSTPAAASSAAKLLALLATDRGDDDATERWYRKLDPTDSQVRPALALLEGRRLLRQGKWTECAAKFAQAAKWYLDDGNYNNVALAHEQRYSCSGDLTARTDAEAALEQAYRAAPEHPIVVGNLISALDEHAVLRALAREIDVGALRASGYEIFAALRDGPDRDAIVAVIAADRRSQRAAGLLPQLEVLAPSRAEPYTFAFSFAMRRRDESTALAVVERAGRATLDTSASTQRRAKRDSGAEDAEVSEAAATNIARYDDALARRLADRRGGQVERQVERKTRALAILLRATERTTLGHSASDSSAFARARTEALEAAKLWPALETMPIVIASLIDEAAVTADAAAWRSLRRGRSAIATLAKLAADGAPLAAKIRGAPQWAAITQYARAEARRPTLDDLRLARLLGDAALEARAKTVLDDKLVRAQYQLNAIRDPSNPSYAEAIADLDRR